jgi:hypothetical protein
VQRGDFGLYGVESFTYDELGELGKGDLAVAVVVETAPEYTELIGVAQGCAKLLLGCVDFRIVLDLDSWRGRFEDEHTTVCRGTRYSFPGCRARARE